MDYVKWTEINDWEGETWNFYIPFWGNTSAVYLLITMLPEYSSYKLCPNLIPEDEVDILIKHVGENGYMPEHNKMKGIIDRTKFENLDADHFESLFYKGGLDKIGLEDD